MPAAAALKLSPLSSWTTELLRLSAFHQLGPQKDDNGWWEAVTGTTPETKNLKPREGGYEVAGPYGGGTLTLKADFTRFDWLYTAAISLEKPAAGFPTVGPLTEAQTAFVSVAQKWLAGAPLTPSITRIAFGAVILQPVADRVSGYKLLDPYLPYVELDPENSSEFSYTINRHRSAEKFNQLHINRISKWSVVRFQPMLLRMSMGQVNAAETSFGESLNAIRLELDINTDATRQAPFESDQLSPLFSYLVALGQEIAEKGDIK